MTTNEKIQFIADASDKDVSTIHRQFSNFPDKDRAVSAMYDKIVVEQENKVYE